MLLDLSKTVVKLENAEPEFLPNFHNKPELFVASDYAGQHPDREARYEIYSFLICDYHGSPEWKRERSHIRETVLLERTMSFKGLHDGVKRRALPAFLSAVNTIDGVLISIAVSKQFKSLFRKGGALDMAVEELEPYRHWQPNTFEKLLRAVHFVSFLLAALSEPGQRVLWFSDDDDIAPNAARDDRSRTGELGKIWQVVFPNYVPHSIDQLVIGTEKDDDPTRSLADILAIPDLACGAWCRLLSFVSGHDFGHGTDAVEAALTRVSTPTLALLDWFAQPDQTLRRMLCVIEAPNAQEQVEHLCSAPFTLHDFRNQVRSETARRSAG